MPNPDRRMELEARLHCTHCNDAPYLLYRRQNVQPDGSPLATFQNVLWPKRPDVMPPLHPESITCPDCGGRLKRVAP